MGEIPPQRAGTTKEDISVRPLQESDLATADHIMRVAFGTFLGLPEPASFMGDASYVRGAGAPIQPPLSAPRSTASSSVPTSRRTGAASASSGH